jgi:hypothetical protein
MRRGSSMSPPGADLPATPAAQTLGLGLMKARRSREGPWLFLQAGSPADAAAPRGAATRPAPGPGTAGRCHLGPGQATAEAKAGNGPKSNRTRGFESGA